MPQKTQSSYHHIARLFTHEFWRRPKNENIQIDVDELFGDMDLPADQLQLMKQTMKDVDMTQSYIDNSNELVKTGNHAEVIRILTEHRR
jgi:hypothetical protein